MYGTGTGECTVCTVFFYENVRYCTVFLVGVYGKVYGICVKPPWPPCNNNNKLKAINRFTSISVLTTGENLLPDKKKKIHTRSLAEA